MVLTDITSKEFIERLASKDPIPGGGGASAMVAAIGIALGNMVASLTVGKKKYADVEEDIIKLAEKTTKLQEEMIKLVDKDAQVFIPLAKAYGMPSDTEEEKKEKAKVMEDCLKTASTAPFEIMEKCGEAILLQKEFANKGSKLAISDAGVGVSFCKAAMEGASLNVFINTGAMKNREVADEIDAKTNDILNKYLPIADEVFRTVKERL